MEIKTSLSTSANELKKAIKLARNALPDDLNKHYTLFKTGENKIILITNASGHCIKQILDAEIKQPGQFVLDNDFLLKIKFPSKQVSLDLLKVDKGSEKDKGLIRLKSGKLTVKSSDFLIENKRIENTIPKEIELSYHFGATFFEGLDYLSFTPVAENYRAKVIRIKAKKGFLELTTSEPARGARFCIPNSNLNLTELDLVADFKDLLSIISALPEKKLDLGVDFRSIRICGGNLDYQFPYRAGNVGNVADILVKCLNDKPEYLFQVDADLFKQALRMGNVSRLSNKKENHVILNMFQKEDKSYMRIIIGGKGIQTESFVPLINLKMKKRETRGLAKCTDALLKDMFPASGPVKFHIYEKLLILEYLNFDLKFMIPRVA